MEGRIVISSIKIDNASRTDIFMDAEANSRTFCNVFYCIFFREIIRGKTLKNEITATANIIREVVNSFELSEVKYNKNFFYLRSSHNALVRKILNILKIKHLKNIIDKEEISSYLS
jgi:hypothetical protein